MQKIPATVVTGFLGAGKTTLIRHILANAGGRRIALIVNEFGDIGVDGEILKGCGIAECGEDDIVELSNGCLCCTVAEDFVPSMTRLIEREAPPEHIVIETSGLALPQPLLRAFAWPEIRTSVTLDGVVAVVDGPAAAEGRFAADEAAVEAQRAADATLEHATPLEELFEDQLASADMVIVSKRDLMGGSAAETLAGRLGARLRAGVQVVSAEQGAVDPGVLLGLGLDVAEDLAARGEIHHRHDHDHHDHDHHHHHDHDHDHEDHHHHHDDHHHHHDHGHDAFESCVIDLAEAPDREALLAAVSRTVVEHGLLRLKGFAAVRGKPMRLVIQAVGPRVDAHYDRPFAPGEARATRLVAIGHAGLDRDAVAAALAPVDAAAAG